MIQETTITELDPRQIKQLEAADKAAVTNPGIPSRFTLLFLNYHQVVWTYKKNFEHCN